MPRFGPFIHQVHIADGFADDCDELIHQCLQVENLNYQTFCNIWKKQNIGCLYKGRALGAEIAELSEEVIHIAKRYMLKNTSNFEESVAGLFILYALLNLQPYAGFAHLRITPDDLPAIDRIEFVARREKRHDVLYILASVLIKGPVQYHAAPREYGLDIAIRKYLEGFTSIDHLGVRPKGVFYRQNEELDVIKELDVITKRYTQAKMEICDPVEFDRNLNYIDSNLPTELQSSLKQLVSGLHEEQYGYVDVGGDSNSIMKNRKQIKEKAMKRSIDPVKYLVTSGDVKSEDKSPTKVPVNSKASKESPKRRGRKRKNNDQSDNKQENTALKISKHVKSRLPISPRAVKKICTHKAIVNKDSSTESQELLIAPDDKIDANSNVTLDSTKTNKKASDKPKEVSEKSQENQEGEEQELDIEIDTLPVLIRTEEQGKLFEIEIIDAMEKTEPAIKRAPPQKMYSKKPKQTALNMISEMPEVSIKKIDDTPTVKKGDPASRRYTENDLAKLVDLKDHKVQPLRAEVLVPCLKKRDKRCLKRAHLQSKFKRLGMLPIANFQQSGNVDVDSPEEVEEGSDTAADAGLDPIDESESS